MQVLCQKSSSSDGVDKICCSVCGQAFQLFWERSSQVEREARLEAVMTAIAGHHHDSESAQAHPPTGFLLPKWSGGTQFSAAALLGGAKNWSI